MKVNECIFCQIVDGKLPASKVYEDDKSMVLMDLFPIKQGHMLIIPKQHGQYLNDHSPEIQAHLVQLSASVIEAAKRADVVQQDCNFLLNDGKVANQHVPHVHFHIIPREKGDFLTLISGVVLRMKNYFGQEARRKRLDEIAQRVAAEMRS